MNIPTGSEIRARRKALRLTQQALAEKAGLDVRVLSAYENDKRRPQKKTLQRLLKALGGMGTQREDDGTKGTSPGDADKTALSDELAQLLGVRDAKVLLVWPDDEGGLAAIAARKDQRLIMIRARSAATAMADLLSLQALVDRVVEQIQGSPP